MHKGEDERARAEEKRCRREYEEAVEQHTRTWQDADEEKDADEAPGGRGLMAELRYREALNQALPRRCSATSAC